jgi:glycerol-3-phosphate dehydrogenase
MRRQPEALDSSVDVLVLGGGALGVALTRTLACSGVGVTLVERGDFGGEASHNSLKTMHGGVRYVQHFDLTRIRESVRAQRAWLSAAPHLVRPLPFAIPTTGWGTRGPLALAAGMTVYRMLAGDRNRGLPPGARLPGIAFGGSRAFRRKFPEVQPQGINGYASWADAQIRDSGRLLTECLKDAAEAGAVVLNHVEAVGLLRAGDRITGAAVRDALTGREYELRAAVTVGALGAWGTEFMRSSGLARPALSDVSWTRNVNIVLKERIIADDAALGLMSRQPGDAAIGRAARLYFLTPWQDVSIVGTAHDVYDGHPDEIAISDAEVETLLGEISATLSRRLTLDDVAYVHMGLAPAEEEGHKRAKRAVVADYAERGLRGYLEVAANKYTTTPTLASDVSRHVMRQLPYERRPADFAARLPCVPVGVDPIEALGAGASAEERERAWAKAIFGTRGDEILKVAEAETGVDTIERLFRARVKVGVHEELAVRLGDAVFRCSDLAERGRLRPAALQWCADFMARELGWTEQQREQEIGAVLRRLRRHMSGGRAVSWAAPLPDVKLLQSMANGAGAASTRD